MDGNNKKTSTRSVSSLRAASASFVILLFFFFVRSGAGQEIFGDHRAFKIFLLSICAILSLYAFAQKLRANDYPDYPTRHQIVNMLIFVSLVASIVGIIIYIFFY